MFSKMSVRYKLISLCITAYHIMIMNNKTLFYNHTIHNGLILFVY